MNRSLSSHAYWEQHGITEEEEAKIDELMFMVNMETSHGISPRDLGAKFREHTGKWPVTEERRFYLMSVVMASMVAMAMNRR